MPRLRSPSVRTFREVVSVHSDMPSSFLRRRLCAGRAFDGIITRPRTSRSNLGAGGAAWGRLVAIDFPWQTRVVMRRITGTRHFSESSSAATVRS